MTGNAPPAGHGLLGAVLAGGASRRFGSDKAGQLLGGVTLVDRASSTLGELFDEVVVVLGKDGEERSGDGTRNPGNHRAAVNRPAVIHDRREGLGPIAGVEAALAEAASRDLAGAFVLACDLPFVRAPTIRALTRTWARQTAPIVAPSLRWPSEVQSEASSEAGAARRRAPRIQPLCAAYSCSVLDALADAIEHGALSLHSLFASAGGCSIGISGGAREFHNVNTAADLEFARRVSREGGAWGI